MEQGETDTFFFTKQHTLPPKTLRSVETFSRSGKVYQSKREELQDMFDRYSLFKYPFLHPGTASASLPNAVSASKTR